MKAVVAHALNQFAVEDVTLDGPRAGEVRLRMAACRVCHSDLSVINGTIPMPLPAVLGHEGAGIVVEVGAAGRRSARRHQPADLERTVVGRNDRAGQHGRGGGLPGDQRGPDRP